MRVIVVFLNILFLCSSCFLRKGEEKLQTYGQERWFYLEDGKFHETESLHSLSASPYLPWTVQARVVDLTRLHDRIFLGINGYGIASLELASGNIPSFDYFYYPIIFESRTITLLFPEDNSVLCHLYFNRTLNTIGEEDLKIQGVSLFRLLPDEENFRFVVLPFQRKNPAWESSTFLPIGNREFYVEWKYTDDEVARFDYTKIDLEKNREEPGSREGYLAAYEFQDIDDEWLPNGLKNIFSAIIETLEKHQSAVTVHFHLRSEIEHVTRRFRYMPVDPLLTENTGFYTVPLYLEADTYYALLPDGTLLWSQSDGKQEGTHVFPPLPSGFVYTGFMKREQIFVVSWEEARFFNVGRAGIFIRELIQ